MPARNTLLQLLALYIDPESHNTKRNRQTDGRHADVNSRPQPSVRSAKKECQCHGSYHSGSLAAFSLAAYLLAELLCVS